MGRTTNPNGAGDIVCSRNHREMSISLMADFITNANPKRSLPFKKNIDPKPNSASMQKSMTLRLNSYVYHLSAAHRLQRKHEEVIRKKSPY